MRFSLGGMLGIALGAAVIAAAADSPAPNVALPLADESNPLGVPRERPGEASAADTLSRGRASPPEPPPEAAAGPIATRQTAFLIPFHLDSAGPKPSEVLLFVSEDGSRSWKPAGRAKPEQGNFRYRAPHDGEYGFAIATIDARAKLHPQRPERPELTVTVDTVVPRLDLAAWAGPDGEMIVRWQAADPLLVPESFKLDYQMGPKDPWQPLALDEAPAAGEHTTSGQSVWWVNLERGLTVRAQVLDRAGNIAVRQVQVSRDSKPPPAAEPPKPLADPISASGGFQPAPPAAQPPIASPAAAQPHAANPVAVPQNWPAERAPGGDWRERNSDTPADQPAEPDGGWQMPADGSLPVRNPFAHSQERAGGARSADRGALHTVAAQKPARLPMDFSLLPAGEQPRMVNSQRFDLEYDVDSVGPSGIAKVELWATTSGGRNWNLLCTDDDNRSPVQAVVPGEGLYGFRIVVQNGAGLGGQPPRTGEPADFWIGVDRTPPDVRLTHVEVLPASGELVVRYRASDERLEARPVSLSYAAEAAGPWTPIAAGLENTGSYAWRMDARVPDQMYVQLEVRDEAGNVGQHIYEEPVTLLRERPAARIRGVRTRDGG